MIEEMNSISLPKWPALLVVGEKVTPQQAQEINIRTSSLPYLSTNNRKFSAEVYEYLYKVKNLTNYWDYTGDINVTEEYGILELEYLQNQYIASAWIGGPHGWCDWQGNIFANNYNIGKWPSVSQVYQEWCLIAHTFPFLNLQCQLLNKECSEHCNDEENSKETTRAVVQFTIEKGAVDLEVEPKSLILEPVTSDWRALFDNSLEIGCSLVEFINAAEYTKSQLNKPKL